MFTLLNIKILRYNICLNIQHKVLRRIALRRFCLDLIRTVCRFGYFPFLIIGSRIGCKNKINICCGFFPRRHCNRITAFLRGYLIISVPRMCKYPFLIISPVKCHLLHNPAVDGIIRRVVIVRLHIFLRFTVLNKIGSARNLRHIHRIRYRL